MLSPSQACIKELAAAREETPTPWGAGKPLLFKDMAAYCEINKVSPPVITYAAMHYGKTHRGDKRTIAALKDHLIILKSKLTRLEDQMDPLNFDDPEYQKLFNDLSLVAGEHQLQLEALEMMDWETAWKLAYGKKDVMDSYSPAERYPVQVEGRPYP